MVLPNLRRAEQKSKIAYRNRNRRDDDWAIIYACSPKIHGATFSVTDIDDTLDDDSHDKGLPWVFILFALFAIALFLLPLLNFAFLL